MNKYSKVTIIIEDINGVPVNVNIEADKTGDSAGISKSTLEIIKKALSSVTVKVNNE